jgi:D-proline reductase (dithiol) PrdB
MSIDSYRFLDFASRQVMKAWAGRQERGVIPFTPLAKPLRECTIALVSTAGISRNDDRPFDQERERRDPWWGDPSYRVISLGTTEQEVRLYHMHIDPRFGQADLDVVLPMRRLTELAHEGIVGQPAAAHFSIMGYVLDPTVLVEGTAPAIADRMRADNVDAVALVPA